MVERELVRVICQAEHRGKTCGHIAARIVLIDNSPVLRFEVRSSLAVDAGVLDATEAAAHALAVLGVEVTPTMFNELALRVYRDRGPIDLAAASGGADPIFLPGFVKLTNERFISTIENFEPIAFQCVRCYAYLGLEGDEVHTAIDRAWTTAGRSRKMKGHFRYRPQR